MLEQVQKYVSDLALGDTADEKKLAPLLRNSKIWGIDLYEYDMASQVLGYFNELMAGKGAVRATLEKYV